MAAEMKELKSERWPDGSVIARTASIPWTEWALPGSYFKLLHVNRSIGMTVTLVKMDPCEKTPPHHHFGDTLVYVLEGGFSYERGDINAGDFICEPGGTTHEPTISPDGELAVVVFFSGLGGVGDDDRVEGFVGCDEMYEMAKANGAADHILPPPDVT